MRRALILFGIVVVVLVVGVFAIAIKQRCKAPGFTCATAPDEQGYIHYPFDVEPLGVALVESLTGEDFPFRYSYGEDLVKHGAMALPLLTVG